MTQKRFLAACVIFVLLVTSCKGATGPTTVKIAISLPSAIGIGQNMLNAAQLALEEAGGKEGDITVELVVFDTSDPEGSPVSVELEERNVQVVVEDETIVAYVGPLASSQSKVSMPILNEASIAQISASATWPGLTKPGYGPGEPGIYYPTGQRHFFRVVPSDEVQGAASARWANQIGVQSVYILSEDTAYGSGVAGIFEITALDLGLDVIAHENYDRATATMEDFAAIAARVVAAGPDLVYLGGSTAEAGDDAIKALREADPNISIMGPDAVAVDDLFEYPGTDLVEGIYGTAVAIPADQLESATAAELLANYQAAYDEAPSPFAVATYEAVKVLLYAIERAEEPTREGVLEAMRNLGNYSGAFGTWHFDERGDISLTAISGMQIQNGAWEFSQIIK